MLKIFVGLNKNKIKPKQTIIPALLPQLALVASLGGESPYHQPQ